MKNKFNKVALDVDNYLKKFINSQKNTDLIKPLKYGLFSGGKKIRSKILIDVGKIFNINYKKLIVLSSAVECIHSYSLIHDDLPCMDNDDIRRGKLSTHKKFGESTAVLAGNSLLTLAFEIISDKKFKIKDDLKVKLINLLAKSSGHLGIAGGQYLDLNFEKKKVNFFRVVNMQIKKTGELFSFCCMAPAILKRKKKHVINDLNYIGSRIGLLFQLTDDLIDYKGDAKIAGKKTGKDIKKGKATLINYLKYKNSMKYLYKLEKEIILKLKKYGSKTENLIDTIKFITYRTS